MAKDRQLARIAVGKYTATARWEEKNPNPLESDYVVWAESIPVTVAEKWVYLHLPGRDVRLSRTRNQSAQVYVGMSFRDVAIEKITNRIWCSSRRTFGYEKLGDNGQREFLLGSVTDADLAKSSDGATQDEAIDAYVAKLRLAHTIAL